MKRLWFLVLIGALWSCKDDEPGPDLSSATLSIVMDSPPENLVTYYAVVSDSSGNVLEWKELELDKQTDLPYPPDPKLAVLTIIRRSEGNSKSTSVMTFTEVAAGTYTYSPDTYQVVLPDVNYTLNIEEMDTYHNMFAYVTPKVWSAFEDNNDGERVYTLGLYNNSPQSDMFIMGARNSAPREYRYISVPNIQGGESMTVTAEDFATFAPVPDHVLNYPAHSDLLGTFSVLYGYNAAKDGVAMDIMSWTPTDIPKLAYPEVENIFASYETVVISSESSSVGYMTDIIDDAPVLNISTINATVDNHKEITGKRISVDLSGDGDIFYGSASGQSGVNSWQFNVFAPKSSRIRINPPQFPQELSDKVPGLDELQSAELGSISVDNYNMTYEQLYKFKLTKGYYGWPTYLVTKSFLVDGLGSGRMSFDAKSILKRYGKESLLNKLK